MTTFRTDAGGRRVHPDLPITFGRLMDFPDDPIVCMRRLHETHGDIAGLHEDGQMLVFVFSPEYNQRVLSDAKTFHSRFFSIRGPRRSPHRRLTSGLLSMNGDEHRAHRRMVMSPFAKRALPDHREPVCQLAREMLDDWQPGQVRDLHADMNQFMLRVTSAILFGLDVPELAFKLGEMIDHWVGLNHRLGIGVFVSDRRLTDGYDELLELAAELETDVQRMIDLKRAGGCQGHDVLSLLIRNHDDEGVVSDEKLIGHVTLLFGAAHLTTAHSLTWTLFLLAQHPHDAREVVDEIRSVLSG
ncbi:MAG: cytochrome P450, partial [Planctomycetaceae bacterium]